MSGNSYSTECPYCHSEKILDKVKEWLYNTNVDNIELLTFIKEQELKATEWN